MNGPPPLPPRRPAPFSEGERRAGRLDKAGLAELVGAMIEKGHLPASRRQALMARSDEQEAWLIRLRLNEARGLGGSTTVPTVTPVEVFLSFAERDADDRPFREDLVTEVWASVVGLPYVKLDPLKLDPAFAVRIVSKPFARKNGYLAIDEENGFVRIATSNPFDRWALESVERSIGKPVRLVMSSKSDIDRLITEFYGFRQSVEKAERQINSGIDLGNLEQFVRMKSEQEIEASDEHVVVAVDYMLRYAFGQRASDIHIEPKRNESLVRFRIDGSLTVVSRVPRVVHNAFVNRIKALSRLDIAEKRKPQDGRIKTEFEGKPIDIRVSTLPVAFGEKVVLRVFDPAMVSADLGTLGFAPRDQQVFEELIALPHGIILVTGPTGSGKTTSLYTALRKLATDDINITTIEDPIENIFEGINQTAILPAIGLGFAEVLRNILRQDPDVIMVGEIRDLDTAQHAIQAALTGHLVLSTLHTNDAASAISRLRDLGVPSFLLASTLVGVMAQRLVKKVCRACAQDRVLREEEMAALRMAQPEGQILVSEGQGCAECRQTGYVGRSAIVELFRVTPEVRRLIHRGADDFEIKAEARKNGMLTLRESAIRKMLTGETTWSQVVETTGDDAGSGNGHEGAT